MTILQKAYDALDAARSCIDRMEARQPAVHYHLDDLRSQIAQASSGLRTARLQGDLLTAAQAHGAKVAALKLGDLRIEDRTGPRRPPAWAVCDAFGCCLSVTGELDDEPQPSSRTPEWLDAHRWYTAEDAIEAAARFLASGARAV